MVSRLALIKELASIVSEDVLVVSSIGNNSAFWGELAERESNLFHATLGMCSAAALGLALALPKRKVIALDADGNLILNLGVLGTVANENATNLIILVMDNGNYLGSHKKAPGMPTATGGKMKLQEVAKGCGIASSQAIQDVATFRETVQMALKNDGPHFICAQIEAIDTDRPGKNKRIPDPRENKYQFAKYIERTSGVQILGGGLGNFG